MILLLNNSDKYGKYVINMTAIKSTAALTSKKLTISVNNITVN